MSDVLAVYKSVVSNGDDQQHTDPVVKAGPGSGIDIDTPFQWVVEGVKEPIRFFEHLPLLLPPGSILYCEGTRIVPEVAAFYSTHRAANAVEVARDTISPEPQIFHITFSADVSAGLCELARNHVAAEMCDHIKAYRDETLLFSFHDAFEGRLRISDNVPANTVAQFCDALGGASWREQVSKPDPEQFRKLGVALDRLWRTTNPWYQRAWWWLTKK